MRLFIIVFPILAGLAVPSFGKMQAGSDVATQHEAFKEAAFEETALQNAAFGPEDDDAVASNVHITTRWLPNGLRLVTVTGPWQTDLVSIRIVIQGGCQTIAGPEKLGVHFLEHLVFNRMSDGDCLDVAGKQRGGWIFACADTDHELHEYDVDSDWAAVVLATILGEWNRDAFDPADVERERRRVLHELTFLKSDCGLGHLGHEYEPRGHLSYLVAEEAVYVDSVSARTLRRVFSERYVGHRMSLLVAGRRSALQGLEKTLERFGAIPAGAERPVAGFGELPWLSGDVGTSSFCTRELIGIHFAEPGSTPSHIRSMIRGAIFTRVIEELKAGGYYSAGPDVEVCYTPTREIWALHDDGTISSLENHYEWIHECLGALANEDERPWWSRYLHKTSLQARRSAGRPDWVLDTIVEDVVRSARTEPARPWSDYEYAPDTDEVLLAYYDVYQRAVAFQTQWDRDRVDWSSFGAIFMSHEAPDFWHLALTELGLDGVVLIPAILAVLITTAGFVLVLARVLALSAERLPRRWSKRHDRLPRRRRAWREVAARAHIIALAAFITAVWPAGSAASPVAPRVQRLANGLQVVEWPVDTTEEWIAVRLVVQRPVLVPGSRESGVYTVLLWSLFHGETEADDLFDFLEEQSCVAKLEDWNDRAMFSFEVPPALLEALFERLRAAWSAGAIGEEAVERGREASQHDSERTSALADLLAGPDESDVPWDWYDISIKEVRDALDRYMVASRVGVVIAAPADLLEQASSLASTLEAIPAGAPRVPARDAEVPPRPFRWSDGREQWAVGVVVEDRDGVGHGVTGRSLSALCRRVREVLARREGLVYDVDTETRRNGSRFILLLEPWCDWETTDQRAVSRRMESVARELAKPATLPWWQGYVEGERRWEELFGIHSCQVSAVADRIAWTAPWPAVTVDGIRALFEAPTAEEARRQYADMLERSRFVVVRGESPNVFEKIGDASSRSAVVLWGDVFGPDGTNRTIALMCLCLSVLLVLRRVDGWCTRSGGEKGTAAPEAAVTRLGR